MEKYAGKPPYARTNDATADMASAKEGLPTTFQSDFHSPN
jgi:hypothetical protein